MIFEKNILITCIIVLCIGAYASAQTLSSVNDSIQKGVRTNDTLFVTTYLQKANEILDDASLSETDFQIIKYEYLVNRYRIKFSKINIDEGLQEYQRLQQICEVNNYSELNATLLGRLANGYRSKRQLGKAYEYNQKEIAAATKNNDSLLVARALITELDISYNALPWPLQKQDLDHLVEKGKEAIAYATENKLNNIAQYGILYVSKFYIKQGAYKEANSLLQTIQDDAPLSIVFSKYEHLCELSKLQNDLIAYRNHTLAFKKYAYRTNRPFVALNVHNYLLDYALQINQPDSAFYYAKKLENNLQEVDTTKYLDFLDITYTALARFYEGKNTEKELQYTSYSAQVNKIIAQRQREAFIAIEHYKEEVETLASENDSLNESQSLIKKNLKLVLTILGFTLLLMYLLFRLYKKSKGKVADVLKEKEIITEKVQRKSIALHNKQRIYLDSLKYIKSDRNYVELFTEEKKYLDRTTLSDILSVLPPNFLQVHRSYIVNRNFIASVSGNSIWLSGKIEIPFSRSFKSKLKDIL